MESTTKNITDILSAPRIRWSLLATAEIHDIIAEAGTYGDSNLIRRGRRALGRR